MSQDENMQLRVCGGAKLLHESAVVQLREDSRLHELVRSMALKVNKKTGIIKAKAGTKADLCKLAVKATAAATANARAVSKTVAVGAKVKGRVRSR